MRLVAGVLFGTAIGCCCFPGEDPPAPALAPPPSTPVEVPKGDHGAPAWVAPPADVAPQPGDVDGLFHEVGAASTRVDRIDGVLLCRVTVTGEQWDQGSGVDLGVLVRLGAAAPFDLAGRNGRNSMTFGIPRPSLRAGDAVSISLRDRDLFKDDPIVTLSTTWDGGLPLRVEERNGSAECRALPSATAAAHVSAAVAPLDDAFRGLERARPDSGALEWGYPLSDVERLRSTVTQMAGLVGWRAPEVEAALARLATFDARWDATARPHVAKVVAALPPRGSPTRIGDVELTVTAFECGPQVRETKQEVPWIVPECAISLGIVNRGAAPVDLTDVAFGILGDAIFVSPNGRGSEARRVGDAQDLLAAGASTTWVLAGYEADSGWGTPVLLRMRDGSLLRVE